MIEVLLQYGANPNKQENHDIGQNTPLHKATEKNMIDVVDLFLQYGGDPTIKNKSGFTCLHIAARDGRAEIVKLFVNKGMDPNIRDAYGFSAAYWAKQNKHNHVCELLPGPLKITKEELYDHITTVWEKHGFKPTGKKKKGKKGKKKK